MTVPVKIVRVGPFDIQLVTLTDKERDNNMGTFSDTSLTIALRETYSLKQQEAETLLHEILHAIYEIMGVKAKDTEERVVAQMSIGLAGVIRDNPELMTWLIKAMQ
jgi:hypothetical protein